MDKLSGGVSDHLWSNKPITLNVDGRLTLSCLYGDAGCSENSAVVSPRPKETQFGGVLLCNLRIRSLGLSNPPPLHIKLIYLVILSLSIPKFASRADFKSELPPR